MKIGIISLLYATVAAGAAYGLVLTFLRGLIDQKLATKYLVHWFVITAIFFLSPHAMVFLVGALLFLLMVRANFEPLPAAAFFVLMIPAAGFEFGKLPGVNYIIMLSFPLLLSMVLLTGTATKRWPKPDLRQGGAIDVLVLIYYVATSILIFREASFTHGLRLLVTNFFLVLVPYYAFSRGVRSLDQMMAILRAFVFGALILAVLGVVTSALYWNFYLWQDIKLFDGLYIVKSRGGMLRTGTTFSSAYIDYGIALMMAWMLANPAFEEMKGQLSRAVFVGVIVIAAFMSASRGPFVAAVFGLASLAFVKPNPARSFIGLAGGLAVAAVAASFTETGRNILAYLPFVGSVAGSEVTYRQDLLDAGWTVIKRTPWLGNPHYLEEPELEALRQGEGIIDIVNDYLGAALRFGLPVAGIYSFLHVYPGLKAGLLARSLDPATAQRARTLGAALAAALAVYAVGYFTTSKQSMAPMIGWMLIGLNVAYVRITVREAVFARHGRPAAGEREASLAIGAARMGQ